MLFSNTLLITLFLEGSLTRNLYQSLKMLKSTYKPAPALPPLPAGWTEHTAPTGKHPNTTATSLELLTATVQMLMSLT